MYKRKAELCDTKLMKLKWIITFHGYLHTH